jgi:ribonuclease P protein component
MAGGDQVPPAGRDVTRSFAFPRQARLRREQEFKRVYQGGKRLQVAPLRFVALRRSDGQSRLGLSISRKVGDPVVRNRWKRAIREAFRLNRHLLREPFDLVVSVSGEAGPEEADGVESAFRRLIEELNKAEQGPEAYRAGA